MEDSKTYFSFDLYIILIAYLFFIAYAIKDKLGGDNNCGLFAVFDGHGGK